MAGMTAVLTLFPKVPIPGTQGYIHLGDAGITFTALTLGPFTAAIAGGLGTAVADLLSGYAQWSPISLVVHGVQGLVAGLLARLKPGHGGIAILAGVVGCLVMVAGYLLGGLPLEGPGKSLFAVPWNLLQGAAGIVLGIPLSLAVGRAYPPVRNLAW
jgi:uncharacterized membrane protein